MQKTMAKTDVISQDVQHLKLRALYFPEVPGLARRSGQDLSVNSPENYSRNAHFSLEGASPAH